MYVNRVTSSTFLFAQDDLLVSGISLISSSVPQCPTVSQNGTKVGQLKRSARDRNNKTQPNKTEKRCKDGESVPKTSRMSHSVPLSQSGTVGTVGTVVFFRFSLTFPTCPHIDDLLSLLRIILWNSQI